MSIFHLIMLSLSVVMILLFGPVGFIVSFLVYLFGSATLAMLEGNGEI